LKKSDKRQSGVFKPLISVRRTMLLQNQVKA